MVTHLHQLVGTSSLKNTARTGVDQEDVCISRYYCGASAVSTLIYSLGGETQQGCNRRVVRHFVDGIYRCRAIAAPPIKILSYLPYLWSHILVAADCL